MYCSNRQLETNSGAQICHLLVYFARARDRGSAYMLIPLAAAINFQMPSDPDAFSGCLSCSGVLAHADGQAALVCVPDARLIRMLCFDGTLACLPCNRSPLSAPAAPSCATDAIRYGRICFAGALTCLLVARPPALLPVCPPFHVLALPPVRRADPLVHPPVRSLVPSSEHAPLPACLK